jgi:hypothetical protein
MEHLQELKSQLKRLNNQLNRAGEIPPIKSEGKKMEYQPKTGEKCNCKKGVQRDNCPNCEGTGWRIDFAAIRESTKRFRNLNNGLKKEN